MTVERAIVRLRRTIFAPPDRVYRAWLDPDLMRAWLAPNGFAVTRVRVDEHVGGRYRVWIGPAPDETTITETTARRGDAVRRYLREIGRVPPLTAAQEIALAKRIERNDPTARFQLIDANLRLVVSVAKRYTGRGMRLLDLIHNGNAGLARAVEHYDWRGEGRFSAYAESCIREAITRGIAENRGSLDASIQTAAGILDCKVVELVPNERIVLRGRFMSWWGIAKPAGDSLLTISLRRASGGATRLTLVYEPLGSPSTPVPLEPSEATEHVPREELGEIWRQYKASGDRALRDRLILTYAPLVKYVAGKLGSWLPPHVEEGDLISYGLLGLIGAIERFEPDREIKFETYAISRIRGAMIDELRSLDWVPRSVRNRAREIERAMAELENRHKRTPSDEEVAGELGITVGEFEESLTQIARSSVVALDELWSGSGAGGGSTALIDAIEDRRAPYNTPDIRQALAQAITRLPDRERLVVTLYYYEELTLREIGEVLSVTESRVSQLHAKAILWLRAHLLDQTAAAQSATAESVAASAHPAPSPVTADPVDWYASAGQMPGMAESTDRGWLQALNRLASAIAEADGQAA